jgi:membrane fusion protein, heavy metal efflux system
MKHAPFFPAILAILAAAAFAACSGDDGDRARHPAAPPVQVLDNGAQIRFADGEAALFTTAAVGPHAGEAEVRAPAHVGARIARTQDDGQAMVLFDAQQTTTLYSQFLQKTTDLNKARNELARVQDMYDNKAATTRDLDAAHADVTDVTAELNEVESNLRALGFDPHELRTLTPGTVLLISDVPEALLDEVRRGERADVIFTSLPGAVFTGWVAAIGDVLESATRTVKVRITLSAKVDILPGMYATVGFGVTQSTALMVPLSAVVTVLGRNYVFVRAASNVFERREVQLGKQIGANVAIAAGLRSGEAVVVSNAMLLKGLSFGY